MATEIDSLFISLGLDVSKFDAAQQKVVNRLREVDDKSQRTSKQMQHGADVIGDGFTKAKDRLLEFALAFGSVAGVKEFIGSMVTGGAELGRVSLRLGMNVRDLQAFGAAMKTVGGTASEFAGSVQNIEGGLARLRFGDTAILTPLAYLQAQDAVNLQTGKVDWYKLADDLRRNVQTRGMQPTLQLAHQLGIDDHTFMLLIKGGDAVRKLVDEMKAAQGPIADNVRAAQALQREWAGLEQTMSGLGQNIFGNMTTTLIPLTHGVDVAASAFKHIDDDVHGVLSSFLALVGGTAALEHSLLGLGKTLGLPAVGGALATLSAIVGKGMVGWELLSHADPLDTGEASELAARRAGTYRTPATRTSSGRISGGAVPRNLRNRNPGNIEYGPFAIAHGATGSDGRFAIFPTMEAGVAAQFALIDWDVKHGRNTLAKLIGSWSPASENGQANTDAYIRQVSKATGIAPNAPLDPTQYTRVAWAMERHEAGTTVETHIQNLNVHTKATDANGIVKDMHSALQQNALINYGVGGVN